MGALALPSRAELEIVGVLIIIAAVLMWLGFHDASIKAEALAPVVAVQKAQLADQKTQEAQTDAAQADALHETIQQNAAHAADARDLAAAVAGADRLRDDAIRRSTAARNPSAAQGSPAGVGDAPGMVPIELYLGALSARAEAERDAAGLAIPVDALGAAGSGGLCARDYDALGGQVKP